MRILVAYASRYGSTQEIAQRIAAAIRTHGWQVDVRSVDEISTLDSYEAVVLGSGVYDGSWTPEATDITRRHSKVLLQKPVWLFSVGTFGDRHPIIGSLMKKEPREIDEIEHAIHPRDYRVFAGVIELDRWPAWGKLVFRALGGHDGDNRDWADIEEWAGRIASELPITPA
jgi:menaquinone-dependent protoporphyrinogen oxidase